MKSFKLYVDGTDKTSDLTNAECTTVSVSKVTCTFTAGKDQTISAGGSKVFELKATTNNVVADDYVTVQVKEDTAAQAGTFAAIVGNDVDGDGNNDDLFIWSDKSGSPHNRTTSDWFNGYKVNGLDTTATTLQN